MNHPLALHMNKFRVSQFIAILLCHVGAVAVLELQLKLDLQGGTVIASSCVDAKCPHSTIGVALWKLHNLDKVGDQFEIRRSTEEHGPNFPRIILRPHVEKNEVSPDYSTIVARKPCREAWGEAWGCVAEQGVVRKRVARPSNPGVRDAWDVELWGSAANSRLSSASFHFQLFCEDTNLTALGRECEVGIPGCKDSRSCGNDGSNGGKEIDPVFVVREDCGGDHPEKNLMPGEGRLESILSRGSSGVAPSGARKGRRGTAALHGLAWAAFLLNWEGGAA